jgi:hypothetical protein
MLSTVTGNQFMCSTFSVLLDYHLNTHVMYTAEFILIQFVSVNKSQIVSRITILGNGHLIWAGGLSCFSTKHELFC